MKRWLVAVGATAMFVLTGCQPSEPPVFKSTDITGASFARDFRLTDHHGETRSLADFKGRVVAVFFGYTHCPDVCPTTLSDFSSALKQYVPAFNSGFLGMYTDEASLKLLAKEYKVVYQKTSEKGDNDYLIDHSAGTYIYDTQGRLRLLMPYGSSPETIAHDLKILLEAD